MGWLETRRLKKTTRANDQMADDMVGNLPGSKPPAAAPSEVTQAERVLQERAAELEKASQAAGLTP